MIQETTPLVAPEWALTSRKLFCFGTHHKTGTVWMGRVVRAMARRFGIPAEGIFRNRAPKDFVDLPMFLCAWNSDFPEHITAHPACRILHLIRDPRDVLISGARYHCHAGPGEEFLHLPRPELDGRSYQEHIASLPYQERLRFEMREKHAETLAEMLAWDYGAPNTVELRYEQMMQDTQGWRFKRALRALGFNPAAAGLGRRVFLRNSLFGGLSDPENRPEYIQNHVADGSIAQWRHKLPRRVAEEYAELYGAALVTLGYEPHPTAWLDQIEA